MLANIALLCYNHYSDKERVIICVLKGILDVCFSVKSAHEKSNCKKQLLFSVIFALQRVILLRSDIRISTE